MSAAVVDLNGKLRLHPGFSSSLERVGRDRLAVLVIDNFLSSPELLVDYASAHSTFDGVSDAFYPGVRAPIPPIYCFAVRAFLGGLIADSFGLQPQSLVGELAHFSVVTTPPARLNAWQRMPHIDNTNPNQLAVLHYLCGADDGGTSFYRHRGTGFEFVDEPRAAQYKQSIGAELAAGAPPAGAYICGDSAQFERTGSFAAAFNRVLIYRSINLHSADIAAGFAFNPDPRLGRLTANTFFYYR